MVLNLFILLLIAAFSAIAGGALGHWERVHPAWMRSEWRHGVIAFGGGALLAAVALVLAPKGMELQPAWASLSSFTAGAVVFMACDRYFTTRGTPMSQLLAMLLDFVPEAIVVGAVISKSYKEALFLTLIIAAQNIPEAFNAYREIKHKAHRKGVGRHALAVISLAALSGIGWGFLGYLVFTPDHVLLGTIMTFCAGGIVFLVFRDVAPQAKLERSWYPSMGAVLGFMVGMAGHLYVAG
ncbi:ZIP family metal transporter [Hyphococcus luteus]|uniref:Divalent cation transporter n=1 Tax=Hyphococcus luteus TaxID=2058213 RepID=A0A2S7K5P0_9PROT|nr:divalent cation transporter [Marinicaulis flavus]PQA87823.1 divalent cation transporter [Marinicaulis flavus]